MSNIEVSSDEIGITCSSDLLHLNYIHKRNNLTEGSVCLSFYTSGLKDCLFTMNYEQIVEYLFAEVGTPISERSFYYPSVGGEERVQIQLVNSRIFLFYEQALEFADVLFTFQRTLQDKIKQYQLDYQ